MSTNPFEALMTPERLQATRKAEFEAIKKERGLNAGASMIADAGFQIRKALREQGYGLTPEDKRAVMTQGILQSAQQSIAQMVADGELDPLDAQDVALSKAVSEFMAMGDYEAAQSLLQPLAALRAQKGELAKLGAQTYRETAAGDKYISDADLAQYRKGEIDANVRMRDAAARAADAQARLRDRTDPNLRAAGGAGTGGTNPRDLLTPSAREKLIDGMANAVSFFDKMADLYDITVARPAALSAPGGAQAAVQEWMAGLQSWVRDLGVSPGKISDPADQKVYAANAKRINETARQLGVDVARFNSLVIDLAFSLARANDPGGRLSNNDFDYSLKMLGAGQNPAAAVSVFKQVSEYVYSKATVRRRVDPEIGAAFADSYAVLDDEFAKLAARWEMKQQPPGTAPAESDEAILQRFLNP